jgi:hypothetical protein
MSKQMGVGLSEREPMAQKMAELVDMKRITTKEQEECKLNGNPLT